MSTKHKERKGEREREKEKERKRGKEGKMEEGKKVPFLFPRIIKRFG